MVARPGPKKKPLVSFVGQATCTRCLAACRASSHFTSSLYFPNRERIKTGRVNSKEWCLCHYFEERQNIYGASTPCESLFGNGYIELGAATLSHRARRGQEKGDKKKGKRNGGGSRVVIRGKNEAKERKRRIAKKRQMTKRSRRVIRYKSGRDASTNYLCTNTARKQGTRRERKGENRKQKIRKEKERKRKKEKK